MNARREFVIEYERLFPASRNTGGRTQVHAPEEYCNQAGLALRTVQNWKCLLDPEKFEFNSGCQTGFAKNKARIPRCLLLHDEA